LFFVGEQENHILIPSWTYFHCPGNTLVIEPNTIVVYEKLVSGVFKQEMRKDRNPRNPRKVRSPPKKKQSRYPQEREERKKVCCGPVELNRTRGDLVKWDDLARSHLGNVKVGGQLVQLAVELLHPLPV